MIKLRRLFAGTCVFWGAVVVTALVLSHRVDFRSKVPVEPLASAVPVSFGDWQGASSTTAIVNPQLQESLQKTYDDTLSRGYVNRITGEYVMLSIAYGRNQSHATQVHKPEVCYPSQGFRIDSVHRADFRVVDATIPVTTLHATLGPRSEYIAYWMVQGNAIVRGALQQNLRRALLAVRGVAQDGLLFRVSDLSDDEGASMELLRTFSNSLVQAMSPAARARFVPGNVLPQGL
jgi:EpsI family protein